MLVGYARVSSTEQETTLQLDALKRAGVTSIHQEKRSAGVRRPVLERMLDGLRPGDVVVVYKVDRLARSLADLLRILDRIQVAGASFKSVTEAIETNTAIGVMTMHILGAVAQFERSIIRERSMAGQDAAWARGVRFGRPRGLDAEDEAECVAFYATRQYTLQALADYYGCHKETVRRAIKRACALDLATAGTKMAQRARSGRYPCRAR